MCGIAGFSGTFAPALLDKMSDVFAHRGPDGSGNCYIQKAQVGLAHRRLAIIDTSDAGNQPMWDATKTVAIVFNGEIYNFPELRDELIKANFQFNNHTDTEVLLNLYLRDGIEMLNKLNGIFAFAIYDSRDKKIFLARDHVGVKPLYYTQNEKGFLFASELKSILQESSVSRELNPQALHYHLRYLWCPSPHTMIGAIKKLSPGNALVIEGGAIKKQWQYYDLPYSNPIENYSESEAIELVQDKFKAAVKRQLIADVPVGAFLSGGLDSSAIVAMVKEIDSGRDLQCFTMDFDTSFNKSEGAIDDLPYAKRVAKHLGVNLNIVQARPDIVKQLDMMVYHLDEPQADPAALNTFLIANLAKENGIKVLLSGTGGDDIFTGYRRHYALMQERYWRGLPSFARKLLAITANKIPEKNPLLRRMAKTFRYADLDQDKRIASYFYWLPPKQEYQLLSEDYRINLQDIESEDVVLQTASSMTNKIPFLNQMLCLEAKYFLADHNLAYVDKMSMAASVETRVPFLDIELIDLATRLPLSMKYRGRVGKWILKKAMEPYLPKDIIYRQKTGFGAPLRHWIKNDLQELISDSLSESTMKRRGLFDATAVQQLIADNQSGKIDAAYTIFTLLCVEKWCENFI
jgi:asparagine synthase (glutamine-hydrolysing)